MYASRGKSLIKAAGKWEGRLRLMEAEVYEGLNCCFSF